MKRYGVDSAHSWFLVAASTLVIFTSGGAFVGTAGVLYVALLETEKLSEKEASLPSSIHGGMAVIAGPLMAYLSTKFSLRSTASLGFSVYIFGFSICFMSSNLYFFCAFYGAVSGLAIFTFSTQIPALMTRAFQNFRSTAIGIVMTSIPLATLIYPVITRLLLQSYGLRGTMLLLSGINLHGILGAIALVEHESNHSVSEKNRNRELTENLIAGRSQKMEKLKRSSRDGDTTPEPLLQTAESSLFQNANTVSLNTKSVSAICQRKSKVVMGDESRKGKPNFKNHTTALIVSIIRTRGFHLSNLASIMSYLLMFMFVLVIIDYSKKKGIPDRESVYLIPIFSVGHFFGRLFLGWFIDKKIVPKVLFLFTEYMLLALIYFIIPHFRQYYAVVIATVLSGVVTGNMIPEANILFSDYLPRGQIIMAMAISRSCVGLASIFRSLIIDIFYKDNASYDVMFYFMGGLSVFTGFTMLFEYLWSKRDTSKQCLNEIGT